MFCLHKYNLLLNCVSQATTMLTVQSMLTGYSHAATPFSICYSGSCLPYHPNSSLCPHNSCSTEHPQRFPKREVVSCLLPAQYPVMPHMSLKCRTPFSQKTPWSIFIPPHNFLTTCSLCGSWGSALSKPPQYVQTH